MGEKTYAISDMRADERQQSHGNVLYYHGTHWHAVAPENAVPKTIRGRATAWNVPIQDARKHAFVRGAFDEWLREHRPALLWSHDLWDSIFGPIINYGPPIGVVNRTWDDGVGLYFEARFATTKRAEEIARLVAMGAITDVSVGYRILESTPGEKGDPIKLYILKAELWDISPVVMGAHPDAKILEANGILPEEFRACSQDDLLALARAGGIDDARDASHILDDVRMATLRLRMRELDMKSHD